MHGLGGIHVCSMHVFGGMRGFGGCERFRIITAIVLNHFQTVQKTTTKEFIFRSLEDALLKPARIMIFAWSTH